MRTTRNVLLASCLIALAGACGSSGQDSQPAVNPFGITPPSSPPEFPGDGLKRVVPVDTREPLIAENPPVPITGGTLIVTGDGKYAVAADPDRDRVSVVDISAATLVRTIALKPGDEPGRLAEDDQGRVHVALRRAGAVADIDIATGEVLARRAACAAPRGIAFDASARTLRVACASSELVTLPADGGDAVERLMLDSDLRDIVITESGLRISRFKHAELLSLPTGATTVASRRRPIESQTTFPEESGALVIDTLEPEIAWRTVSDLKGGTFMLHQGARKGEIPLPDPKKDEEQENGSSTASAVDAGGVGGSGAFGLAGGSAYGGGGSCSGVVQAELTHIDSQGVTSPTMRFDAVLAVDMAVAPMSGLVVIAQAGEHDPNQPLPTFESDRGGQRVVAPSAGPAGGFGSVMAFSVDTMQPDGGVGTGEAPCVFPNQGASIAGQPTAVAFAPDDTLVVQSREPARLAIMRNFADGSADPGPLVIDLVGESVYDTGHELFHRDAGAQIACASCHAEGGDDGHVWHFSKVGPRRTQSVNVGLEGTQPFHWSGDQANVAALMEDVFVSRMGGVHESAERTHALEGWLFELTPLPAERASDDTAALRGKSLFEGDAQCSTCHNGPKLTNNKTVDVGTGEPLQVPSLRGVGYRAPLIHNGCAATLKDRFDPACGGDKHGNTAELSDSQIDDLIAYLQTL
jgi:hypothetical protein